MAAATKGYDRVVRAILEHGCDVNMGNSVGATALHLAAMTEMGQCVALLLEGEILFCFVWLGLVSEAALAHHALRDKAEYPENPRPDPRATYAVQVEA